MMILYCIGIFPDTTKLSDNNQTSITNNNTPRSGWGE
jgi:hypothetical protein